MKLEDDDFTLFGLPRRFALDESALGARWRELQSRVHPDRFAAEGATAQRLAMQWAVRINEAHRRLKEPLARATYLCELGGHPLLGADAKAVAPDVLARQMQWHEALAEASSADVIRALDAEVRDRLEAVRAEVACELDDRQDPRAAAGRLREWMFLARLRSEIERRLEALEV